jgi:DNA replication ATP-dependent helicase Dna2
MPIKLDQDLIPEEIVFDLLEDIKTREEFLVKLKMVFETLLRQKLLNPNSGYLRLIDSAIEKYNFNFDQIRVLSFLSGWESALARNNNIILSEIVYHYILKHSNEILRRVLENPGIIPEKVFQVNEVIKEVHLPDVFLREKYLKTLLVKNQGFDEQKKHGKIICRMENGEISTILLYPPWDQFAKTNGFAHGQIVGFYNIRKIDEKNIFISDKNTLMIFSPDYTIDVTDIKSCINDLNDYLINRLCYTKKPSAKQIIGNAVNYIFDEMLAGDYELTSENIRRSLNSVKLNLVIVNSSIDEIFDEVCFHLKNITKSGLLERIKKNKSYFAEPSYLSPEFGLNGRIDVLCEDENEIIELKTGKPKDFGAWPNDLSQTALYSLMLLKKPEQNKGKVTVFYSKSDKPYRNIETQYPFTYIESVKRRNEMINIDRKLASFTPNIMNEFRSKLIDQGNSPLHEAYRNKLIELFTCPEKDPYIDLIRNYVCEFISFSERERSFEKLDFASLWSKSEYQKRDEFRIISPLKYIKTEDNLVVFSTNNNESKFREGDICIIYNKNLDISEQQLLRGSIYSVSRFEVKVNLRSKIIPALFSEDKEWNLEGDYMDISSRKDIWACTDFLDADIHKQKIILGLDEPQFNALPELALDEKINNIPKQKEAVQKAIAAKDYFLIQGPPGTGKTTLLAHMIREIIKDDKEKLLVAAFTNKAVDEIIRKIENETDIKDLILRLGNEYATDFPQYSMQRLVNGIEEKNIPEFINSKRVFLSTIASASYNEIFHLLGFTTAIIDEASQITEPETLSVILKTKKFILIGDEKQLPAVISQNNNEKNISSVSTTNPLLRNIGIERLDSSLFERLVKINEEKKWNGKILLDKQYRMHNDILEFPNISFYNSSLSSDELAGKRDLGIQSSGKINSIPVEFFDVKGHGEKKRNPREAELVVKLITKYREALPEEGDDNIGVITPFRAQASLITQELMIKNISGIKVDTIERFQGSEKDIIFISFAVYHQSQIPQIQSRTKINNELIDRKLNVAITRAKKKLIMIGNADLLSRDSIFKKLVDFCKVRGRFIEV